VQAELAAVEQKERESQQEIADLEALAKSRRHITDFAIPKKAQTPAFEQPSALSKIVFHADAEDEFEVVEAIQGEWVRVRLENDAQAWFRTSELERPGDWSVADDFGGKNFSIGNELVQTFTGDWDVLKGKLALYVLAQPKGTIPEDLLSQSQFDFAAYAFLEGYRVAMHSQQTVAGVVVVFPGEKPSVAAATLAWECMASWAWS
jgi:hypothetical protein